MEIKAEDIILQALERERKRKGRGIRIAWPNQPRAEGHLRKARHNLKVADDLKKLGHADWVLVASYYSMYHSALAVLHRLGLDSKEHAATAAVLEYCFVAEGKLDRDFVNRFNDVREMAAIIEEGKAVTFERRVIDSFWRAKQARERAQYSIETDFERTTVDSVIETAIDFVNEIETLVSDLDDTRGYPAALQKKIRNLARKNRKPHP